MLKEFLETTPIGVTSSMQLDAVNHDTVSKQFKAWVDSGLGAPRAGAGWLVNLPRIYIFCDECGDNRHFNPRVHSGAVFGGWMDVGARPNRVQSKTGQNFVLPTHDQFLVFVCGDCSKQKKTFAVSVYNEDVDTDESGKKAKVNIQITKVGEVPKPTKPLNKRLKRLIADHWELYRKGVDDEAAGNGIGAFAYYRRLVDVSRSVIVDAICDAAEKLGAAQDDIDRIRGTKDEKHFAESVEAIKDVFPPGLMLHGRNPLTALYSPLSEGLHNGSDEECLQAATNVRILLDALGEKLTQIIENEDRVAQALQELDRFKPNDQSAEP